MTEKAEVLRGWKSPASRYSRLKAEIEGMQRNIERRKAELQALPVTIEELERDVAQLKIAFAQEQAKVDQEAADELIEQFLSHARDLDAAFTTEKLAMWKKAALQLRSPPYRRAVVSYEAMVLSISRLMQTDTKSRAYRPLRHKSFEDLSRSWLRPASETKAA